MPSRLSKFRIAIYGILVEGGRVLMTETKVPSGTIFNFPGGGLELGEAPNEALVREYREETGCAVEIERLLFCSRVFHQNPEYPAEQLMHIYYAVRRTQGTIGESGNGDDVMGLRWAAPADLKGLRILPVDLEFVESAAFVELFPRNP